MAAGSWLGGLLRVPATAAGEAGVCGRRYGVDFSLDRLSNKVARALLRLGVVLGDRVGILAPKSAAAVVGVYGALKAGACYVSLDPKAPAGRLGHIVRDCGAAVIMADEARASRATLPARLHGRPAWWLRVFPAARSARRWSLPPPTARPLSEPGEVGELYGGGPSLMRGYWGQPARTSEALVRTSTGKVDQAGFAGE